MTDQKSLNTMDIMAVWHMVQTKAEELRGELNEEQEAQLEAIMHMVAAKADSGHYFIRRLDNEVEFYDQEIKRLQSNKKTFQNMLERFKAYLIDVIQQHGPIVGDTVEFGLKKNPPALVITDQSKLPRQFITETVVYDVDKALLKNALKGGAPIDGAELRSGVSLKIGRPKT